MYSPYRDALWPHGRESFPLTWIVAKNLLHLSTWVLAGGLVWPIQWHGWPVVSMAWASLVLVIQVLLKRHNCSGCSYYGKSCHLGWGKLSSWLFAQDSGKLKAGMRLSLFYIISPPVFLLTGILVGLLLPVRWEHWTMLGAYVGLNVLSFPVRKHGCSFCTMRAVCPGSAARPVPPH